MQNIREQSAINNSRTSKVVSGTSTASLNGVEYGNATIDIGRAEAVLRRDDTIPREHLKVGDRVRAYIYDVRREVRGPQIFPFPHPRRIHGKPFAQEVPGGIYDGVIEIKSVARDPGSRAKIAVYSHDNGMDPVGACVGMRSRVQSVVAELGGEKLTSFHGQQT